MCKINEKAMIRNWYNWIPYPAQKTPNGMARTSTHQSTNQKESKALWATLRKYITSNSIMQVTENVYDNVKRAIREQDARQCQRLDTL